MIMKPPEGKLFLPLKIIPQKGFYSWTCLK